MEHMFQLVTAPQLPLVVLTLEFGFEKCQPRGDIHSHLQL